MISSIHRRTLIALAATLPLASAASATDSRAADTRGPAERPAPAHVYTTSNAAGGNAVLRFDQTPRGPLRAAGEYPTGGRGTGGGLGNQSGLVISDDERFLLTVNAGSDDISVFAVRRSGLQLVHVASSGGTRPVSIAIDRDYVYVLNAGSDSIAGFVLSDYGRLYPLPGSRQDLSGRGVGAAQISFSPDGRALVVTERATNNIVVFPVDRNGLPTGRNVIASQGPTPFGFSFNRRRQLIVSEAAGGAASASSASSYRLTRDGDLLVLDSVEPTLQSAACWIVVTPNGRFAYASNTASATISSFRVRANGDLVLVNADGIAARTGAGPIDLAMTTDGDLLYSLNGAAGTVEAFRVEPDGRLVLLGNVVGLPAGANGLATIQP
jgi:6-phosphogluconolactonase